MIPRLPKFPNVAFGALNVPNAALVTSNVPNAALVTSNVTNATLGACGKHQVRCA
jgi:hypothetical protein